MKSFLVMLLLVLSFLVLSAEARNKKHEKAQQATFVLYGHSESRGVTPPLCTAFAYKKAPDGYFLMTAGHCFSPSAPSDAVYLVNDGQVTDTPSNLQPVEVLNHIDDGVMDVAELHLKTKKNYPVLELDNRVPRIDEKIFYVGYPEMVAQVVYTGRVGSSLIQASPDCNICAGRFLVQTGGGPGASGSPIISERTGKVVGILEGHVFENGIVVVPAVSIHMYYLKQGHV
jgi:hypothetical protein